MDYQNYCLLHQRLQEILQKDIFFIVGANKSGTTWLYHLLNGHPDICCREETQFINHLFVSLNNIIKNHNDYQVKRDYTNFFTREDLEYLLMTSLALLMNHCAESGTAKCYGEKTPNHINNMAILKQIFPRARFIHIIRDVRDVTVSAWFHNLREPGERFKTDFEGRFEEFAVYSAKSWSDSLNKASSFAREFPDVYFEFRYEDLHSSPMKILKDILTFLELDCSEQCVNQCIEAGSFKKLTGGRQRGEEDKNSFFRKGIIGDWKEHLSPESLKQITAICGPLMSKLNYLE